MSKSPVRQITDKQRIMGAVVLFKPHDSIKEVKVGPVGTIELTPNLTEVESRTGENGFSELIGTFVTVKDGTLVLNDIQMWGDWLYSALYMGEITYRTQTAAPTNTLVVEDVAPGDVVRIPGIKPSITSITDGAEGSPVAYAANDYTYAQKTSYLEFVSVPEGAGADATITYALPEITAANKLVAVEFMSNQGKRGQLTAIGVIADGFAGTKQEVEIVLPDVEFRPNGAITQGDTANLNVASLTARVYGVNGSYGTLRYIPQT